MLANNITGEILHRIGKGYLPMTEAKAIAILATYAGEILLRNGAETYRVEETVRRMCTAKGLQYIETFVTPTGIIVNVDNKDTQPVTIVRTIERRGFNLSKVVAVNDFSRQFTTRHIALEAGIAELKAIDSGNLGYRRTTVILSAGIAASAAAILLGGSWQDFLPTLVAAILVQTLPEGIPFLNQVLFSKNYLGGLLAALTAALFLKLGLGAHQDKIIVGALLPLVPGVAVTNSIRDFISGDLISGTIRGVEALLASIAIAGGVGLGLSLYLLLF